MAMLLIFGAIAGCTTEPGHRTNTDIENAPKGGDATNISEDGEGDPSADYESDRLILPGGKEVPYNEYGTLLFFNGTVVTDHSILMREEKVLIPVRFIAEGLGASVDWNKANKEIFITKPHKEIILVAGSRVGTVNGVETELDYPAIVHENITYVPLRFVAENLEATVHYTERYPKSSAETIVERFPSILIDEKYDFKNSVAKEEAMEKVQAVCLEGLENFSNGIREEIARSNGNAEQLEADFDNIENAINNMIYVGEISRFYKFNMGPYDILFDRINQRVFFVIHSSGIWIKEMDVNDRGLYNPVFIVG